MNIQIDQIPERTAVVRPDGRLDLLSAPQMKQILADEVAAGRCKLVVDLAGLSFIDSSGLGSLIGGLKAARLAGGDLRIARPPEQARVILQLTTLDRVLVAYATVEEALAGYA